MDALTLVNDTVIIDEATRAEASELARLAGDTPFTGFSIVIDGETQTIPDSLSRLIVHVLERAAEGGTLTVRTMPDELTTTVAADMLGVSRPTLMKMIHSGEISSHQVGSHTRLKAHDVLRASAERLEAQRASFERLRAFNV